MSCQRRCNCLDKEIIDRDSDPLSLQALVDLLPDLEHPVHIHLDCEVEGWDRTDRGRETTCDRLPHLRDRDLLHLRNLEGWVVDRSSWLRGGCCYRGRSEVRIVITCRDPSPRTRGIDRSQIVCCHYSSTPGSSMYP